MLNEFHSGQLFTQLTENAYMQNAFDIVKGTRAKFGVDGNQFYYIVGNLPEPDCIVGFGDTPAMALNNFSVAFYNTKVIIPLNIINRQK